MMIRFSLVALALLTATLDSEAGPLRRRAQPTYQYPSYAQPTYQYPAYQYPSYEVPSYQPAVVPAESTSNYTPSVAPIVLAAGTDLIVGGGTGMGAGDGLDEVNAKRAARGLRPFVRDEALTQAAMSCASYRAQYLLFGHTSNDFTFLPAGSSAASAGCAAYPASYGWMSCCTYEGYTYAGAAYVTGRDGKRYMHLFVR